MRRARFGHRKPDAAPSKGSTSRPVAELFNESPIRVFIAAISDHTAVLILAHPLPPVGPVVHDAILDEVHRLAQRNPSKGAVSAIEIWAPVAPDQHAMVYREALDKPLHVSLRPLGNTSDAMRGYLLTGAPIARTARASHRSGSPAGTSVGHEDLFIPLSLRPGLANRSIDSSVTLAAFVADALHDAGFKMRMLGPTDDGYDIAATIDGAKVFVRCYHGENKVPRAVVDRFGYDFLRSHYDEALFVSDTYVTYEVRHWERNHRIHLVGRLGLQRLINAVAARHLRRDSEKEAG
ncbi:MAG TPA: restriction endonuclease [Actinomycetota bacterium]|nr:restriction endonuclease [Actinomycetota bacterium]